MMVLVVVLHDGICGRGGLVNNVMVVVGSGDGGEIYFLLLQSFTRSILS